LHKKHRYTSFQLRSGVFVFAIACKLQTKGVYVGEKSAKYLFLLHYSIKNALCFDANQRRVVLLYVLLKKFDFSKKKMYLCIT
jgi:hypothetical protein